MTGTIHIRHDPANGTAPEVLTRRFPTVETDFHEAAAGDWCPRCNADLAVHVWQQVDPDVAEQGGVIDCGRSA